MNSINVFQLIKREDNGEIRIVDDICYPTYSYAKYAAEERKDEHITILPVPAEHMRNRDNVLKIALLNLIEEGESEGESTFPLSESIQLRLQEWDDYLLNNSINIELKNDNGEWNMIDSVYFGDVFCDFSDLFNCDNPLDSITSQIEDILFDLEEKEEEYE